jgi:hypothetical protein
MTYASKQLMSYHQYLTVSYPSCSLVHRTHGVPLGCIYAQVRIYPSNRTGSREPKSERHVGWPSKLTPPSLSGSQEALQSLLRADAPRALLCAISNFRSTDSIALKAACARALRALTVAISETVGPSQWGLRPDTSDIRYEAKTALNYLFQVCGLDHFSARQN